jgi:hypothetical protein
MALEDLNELEKKKAAGQQAPQQSAPAPQAMQPQPGIAQVGGPPRGSQQARAAQGAGPAKTSGFTGAGKILQANVGSRLGQQMAGRVAQAGQQAGQRLGQAVGQFQTGLGQAQTQAGQAYTAGQAALGQIIDGVPQQQVAATEPAPAPVAPPMDASQAYQTAIKGEYTGPMGLEDVEGIQSEVAKAQTLAGATQTTQGRIAALQQMLGRGSRQYTTGQSALDALILGQSGKELQQARRGVAGLGKALGTQEQLAEEQAKQTGADIASKGKELSQAASAAEAKTSADISGQKQAYEKGLDKLYTTLTKEIEAGKKGEEIELSKESLAALKKLGFDESSLFYGLDPKQIANLITKKQPGETSAATSASAEQLKKINALKKLAGGKEQFSEEDLRKAGTTVDPVTGLATTPESQDILSKQKESFEKQFGNVFSESEMAEAKASAAEQERVDRVNAERRARVEDANRREQERKRKIQEAGAFASRKLPPEMFQPIKPNPEDLKQEVNTRGGGIFTYSPGQGNRAIQSELLKQFASGGLYDKETGKLNVDFAKKLKDFWGWRPEYQGKDGWFGAGKYGRYAGDEARVAALQQLIDQYGTGKTFKTKKELD